MQHNEKLKYIQILKRKKIQTHYTLNAKLVENLIIIVIIKSLLIKKEK
jgi:hypothetical protein